MLSTDICSEFSPSPLTSLTRGSSRVAEVAGAEDSSVSGDFPPKMRLFVKDWVAQWDPLYSAWFYYHPQTGQIQNCRAGLSRYTLKLIYSFSMDS